MPILDRIQGVADELVDFDTNSVFNDNVETFKTAVEVVGNSVEDVNTLMANFIEDVLRPQYEYLARFDP